LAKEKILVFIVQFKSKNPFESWTTLGRYSAEGEATINAARKKAAGALMVRVVDRWGKITFFN
jgi:hypothetical protein